MYWLITLKKKIKLSLLFFSYSCISVSKSGLVIGVVEAKDAGAIKDVSIIQCILQLISLQSRESSARRLFGVVTDAYNYIFIQLKGRRLFLDSTRAGRSEDYKCSVHKAETWDELSRIIWSIYDLCDYQEKKHYKSAKRELFEE